MNILLVDDNQYVLEGLLDGIDFSGLGFSQVYTAKSAGKARELMVVTAYRLSLPT